MPLTFALMTNVLAEEAAALQTEQADYAARCRQAEADCRRKAQLEADRQAKTRQRPALEQAAAEADRSAAAQNASADALEGQIAERRAALPYPSARTHRRRWTSWKPTAAPCAPAWKRRSAA